MKLKYTNSCNLIIHILAVNYINRNVMCGDLKGLPSFYCFMDMGRQTYIQTCTGTSTHTHTIKHSVETWAFHFHLGLTNCIYL